MGELFEYPFYAEVWGTVSDWMMVIVTLVTAIFLYLTLKSQNIVQIMQQKQFEMELFKHRQSIKPYLTFTSYKDKIIDNGTTQSYTANLCFTFNKGEARNVRIDATNLSMFKGLSLEGTPVNSVYCTLNDTIYIRVLFKEYPTKPLLISFEDIVFITFTATFEDITGCQYKQLLHYRRAVLARDECNSEIPIEVNR